MTAVVLQNRDMAIRSASAHHPTLDDCASNRLQHLNIFNGEGLSFRLNGKRMAQTSSNLLTVFFCCVSLKK
jgi:hypothetical protein